VLCWDLASLINQVFSRFFTQIRKTDCGFIYAMGQGGYIHYEVFKKRLNRRFGTVSYPTDKAFGIWAWTCMTLERAKDKLEEIRSVSKTNIAVKSVINFLLKINSLIISL